MNPLLILVYLFSGRLERRARAQRLAREAAEEKAAADALERMRKTREIAAELRNLAHDIREGMGTARSVKDGRIIPINAESDEKAIDCLIAPPWVHPE